MMSTQTKILLITIVALAALLRFSALDRIPPGVYPDEAIKGVEGWEAVQTGDFKIFYPSNNGREGLWVNLIGIAEYVFGINHFSLRFWAALFGTLTVLGLFLFTRELFKPDVIASEAKQSRTNTQIATSSRSSEIPRNDIVALIAAFFLATSFWHLNFSRIAFRAIMVPLLMVWSFYFLLKAWQTLNPKRYTLYAILGGLLFGLGFHTYIAFRFAPFVLLTFLIIEYFKSKSITVEIASSSLAVLGTPRNDTTRTEPITYKLKAISFFISAAFLSALPMALYFYQHPQDFIGRAGGVSIFATASPLQTFGKVLAQTLGMLNIRGDCNWRHNMACSPQLLLPVGIFFLIGLGICIYASLRVKRSNTAATYEIASSASTPPRNDTKSFETKTYNLKPITYFFLSWLFFLLAPELLTWEGIPHALRSIGILPPVMIFAALGVNWIYTWIVPEPVEGHAKKESPSTRFARSGTIIFFVVLLSIAIIEPYRYFVVWAKNINTTYAFSKPYMEIGQYLNSLPSTTPRYVIVNARGVLVPHKNPDGILKQIPMPVETVIYETLRHTPATYLLPDEVPKTKFPAGSVVAPLDKDDQLFENLRSQGYEVSVLKFKWFSVGIVE